MPAPSPPSVLAVDVGSSVVKLGWFPGAGECETAQAGSPLPIAAPALPAPQEGCSIFHRRFAPQQWLSVLNQCLSEEFSSLEGSHAVVGSVHPAATLVLEQLRRRDLAGVHEIDRQKLPLTIRVNQPERVGVDRLLGAISVNALRSPHAPAIFVSMGTATTVNLVAADGAFEGGAIFAGPSLQSAALHDATATLPDIASEPFVGPPAVLGKNTEAALGSGAYWGGVGAINELVRRLAEPLSGEVELFITGGAAMAFASEIVIGSRRAKLVPHLVLGGIRLAADGLIAR